MKSDPQPLNQAGVIFYLEEVGSLREVRVQRHHPGTGHRSALSIWVHPWADPMPLINAWNRIGDGAWIYHV